MTGHELRKLIQTSLRNRPEKAWDLCCNTIDNGSPEAQNAAFQFLDAVAKAVPYAGWTVTRRQFARRLGVNVTALKRLHGTCAFPVISAHGDSRFAIVYVSHSDETDKLSGFDCPKSKQAIHDALDAVRLLVGTSEHFSVCADTEVQGDSLGLAVAIAAHSVATGKELRDDFACTGRVTCSGQILGVGLLDEKVLLRARARPRSILLVPHTANYRHPSIREVKTLAVAISEIDLRECESKSPLENLLSVRKAFDEGNWQTAAEYGESLRANLELGDDERIELLAILLCAANHHADPERGEELVEELVTEIHDMLSAKTPVAELARAIASMVVSCVDRFSVQQAQESLALANHWTGQWTTEQQIYLNGSEALLRVVEGQFDEALKLRKLNVKLATPRERPRCLGDLADTLWRIGDIEKASKTITEALSTLQNGAHHPSYMRETQPFLYLHAARIFQALGKMGDARRRLTKLQDSGPPDLCFRARLQLAVINRNRSSCDTALALAPKWMADSAVIKALLERAKYQAGDASAATRLCDIMGLPEISPEECMRRLPY